MVISDARRRALHQRLVETIGADVADTLMDYLPPAGWSDLARQSDIEQLRLEVRAEIGQLRGEMHGEFGTMRAVISDRIAAQTRLIMLSQLALVGAVIGGITAIAH